MDIVLTLKSFFKDSSSTPLVIFEHFHSKIFAKRRTKKNFMFKNSSKKPRRDGMIILDYFWGVRSPPSSSTYSRKYKFILKM